MNKNLETLLKALKSGEYTQARSVLHDIDGNMCCMGVACDLFIDGDWEENIIEGLYILRTNSHNGYSMPPLARMSKILGLSEEILDDLMTVNDQRYDHNKKDYGPVIKYLENYLERWGD